jgi:hypothetical protein
MLASMHITLLHLHQQREMLPIETVRRGNLTKHDKEHEIKNIYHGEYGTSTDRRRKTRIRQWNCIEGHCRPLGVTN